MRWKNTETEYGAIAVAKHWIIAVLIFIQVTLGFYAGQLPTGLMKFRWTGYHKTLGFTLLLLMVARLIWILVNKKPGPLADTPRWQSRIATINQFLLYILLIMIPLEGWLLASVANLPISFWGLFVIPDLVAPSESWIDPLQSAHAILVYILLGLLALHIIAGTYHLTGSAPANKFRMWIKRQ